MTTYTPLSNTTLSQDKPLTQSVARGLRDNPIAIGEAAAGAPRTDQSSFKDTAFFAYKSADQTSVNTSQVMIFNTKEYDGSSWYDAATGKFTPQSPGLYLISARVDMAGSSTQGSFNIGLNQTTFYDISEFTSVTSHTAKLIAIIRFNGTTDYATVGFSNNNSATVTIKGVQKYYSHFFGYKVGP